MGAAERHRRPDGMVRFRGLDGRLFLKLQISVLLVVSGIEDR
jgi:hypothetical protein